MRSTFTEFCKTCGEARTTPIASISGQGLQYRACVETCEACPDRQAAIDRALAQVSRAA